MLAIASSYMHEKGDISHPEDAIFIRQVTDAETKPKWAFPSSCVLVCPSPTLRAAVFTKSSTASATAYADPYLTLFAFQYPTVERQTNEKLRILPAVYVYTIINKHSVVNPLYNNHVIITNSLLNISVELLQSCKYLCIKLRYFCCNVRYSWTYTFWWLFISSSWSDWISFLLFTGQPNSTSHWFLWVWSLYYIWIISWHPVYPYHISSCQFFPFHYSNLLHIAFVSNIC